MKYIVMCKNSGLIRFAYAHSYILKGNGTSIFVFQFSLLLYSFICLLIDLWIPETLRRSWNQRMSNLFSSCMIYIYTYCVCHVCYIHFYLPICIHSYTYTYTCIYDVYTSNPKPHSCLSHGHILGAWKGLKTSFIVQLLCIYTNWRM